MAHADDGLSTSTQTAVFNSEGFSELMHELIDCAWVNQKLSLACKAGLHRSQTAGFFLESLLNKVVDVAGRRVFNARHLTLGRATDPLQIDRIVSDARNWYKAPWCCALKPASEPEVYGYSTAMKSSYTAEVWRGVVDYLDGQYVGYDITEQEWYVGGTRTDGAPAAKMPRIDGPHQPLTKPHTALSVEVKPEPHPPPALPPVVRKPWQMPPPPPTVPQVPLPPAAAASVAQQPQPKQDGQHEPWVSFNQDATVWATVLTDAGVDTTAQKELFILSTHSRAGWEAANALIAKILKKMSDRAVLSNPSAFVHVCCTKARNSIAGGWGPLHPDL